MVARRIEDRVHVPGRGSVPQWADGTNLEGFVGQPGLRLSGCCDWSPDGTRLLLTGRTKVYSLDVDDGELRGWWTWVARRTPSAGRAGHRTVARCSPSLPLRVYRATRRERSRKLADGDLGDWGTSPASP